MTVLLSSIVAVLSASLPIIEATIDPQASFYPGDCSLYCMAAPEPISVSHHISSQAKTHYDAAQMEDGECTTAWVAKGGPGEWFEFTFSPEGLHPDFCANDQRTGVDSLYIINGYNKTAEIWHDHARVRTLEMSVDGHPVALITLKDDSRPQHVALPRTPLRPGMKFRFTIRRVTPGAKYDEVAITEARLDGYGHH